MPIDAAAFTRVGLCLVAMASSTCAWQLNAHTDAVRHAFANEHACGWHQIQVNARSGIEGHQVGMYVERSAPPDVQVDPERLRRGSSDRQALKQAADRYRVFEAAGCGFDEYYACVFSTSTPSANASDCWRGHDPTPE
jgi:Flp pilus assembly protein TadB